MKVSNDSANIRQSRSLTVKAHLQPIVIQIKHNSEAREDMQSNEMT